MNNYNNQNNRNNINRNPNVRQNQRQTRIIYPAPYNRRRKKKPPIAKYGFRFLMFLIFFAVISLVVFAVFYIRLTWLKSNPDIFYTVNTIQIKNDKPETVSTDINLSYNTGYTDGQYYFPINTIMDKMDFVLIGDKNEFSFVRSKSGEYIKFITDSTVVYINDEEFHLSAPPFIDGDDNLYAPVEFLDNAFKNLTFSFDEKNKNKITVDVGDITDRCFKIQKTSKLTAIDEASAPYFTNNPVNFTADLSAYEKYFNPPAETADQYIILVNQTHPLDPQDYVPPDLVDVADTRKDGRTIQQLREYPEKALEAFLIEARANGITTVSVTSAYRSYQTQVSTFNEALAQNEKIYGDKTKAEQITATKVAYPGQSEHQTGLSLDMHNLSAADQNFGNEPEGKWLAENAHYFGFILRYPADKTDITGIQYEPWHFRYVGRNIATKIYEQGLCLEEYWEKYLSK